MWTFAAAAAVKSQVPGWYDRLVDLIDRIGRVVAWPATKILNAADVTDGSSRFWWGFAITLGLTVVLALVWAQCWFQAQRFFESSLWEFVSRSGNATSLRAAAAALMWVSSVCGWLSLRSGVRFGPANSTQRDAEWRRPKPTDVTRIAVVGIWRTAKAMTSFVGSLLSLPGAIAVVGAIWASAPPSREWWADTWTNIHDTASGASLGAALAWTSAAALLAFLLISDRLRARIAFRNERHLEAQRLAAAISIGAAHLWSALKGCVDDVDGHINDLRRRVIAQLSRGAAHVNDAGQVVSRPRLLDKVTPTYPPQRFYKEFEDLRPETSNWSRRPDELVERLTIAFHDLHVEFQRCQEQRLEWMVRRALPRQAGNLLWELRRDLSPKLHSQQLDALDRRNVWDDFQRLSEQLHMKDLTDRIDNTPASTEIDAQTLQELDRYATDFVAGVRRSFARAIWLEHAAQMTANALPTMHRSNWSTWLLRKFSKS